MVASTTVTLRLLKEVIEYTVQETALKTTPTTLIAGQVSTAFVLDDEGQILVMCDVQSLALEKEIEMTLRQHKYKKSNLWGPEPGAIVMSDGQTHWTRNYEISDSDITVVVSDVMAIFSVSASRDAFVFDEICVVATGSTLNTFVDQTWTFRDAANMEACAKPPSAFATDRTHPE
jgi:hypothetical protein